MIKLPYSQKFYPPAPVMELWLALADHAPVIGPVIAMIDTGADGTFVPSAFLERMDSPVERITNVRSHLGNQRFRVALHKVDFVLSPTIRLPDIEVISNDWDDFIILGRNFLNKLTIVLDGIKQTTRVSA